MTGGFKGGAWNAISRGKTFVFPAGEPNDKPPPPNYSIQCFEQRHHDCGGKCPLMGHVCECECHGVKSNDSNVDGSNDI